MSEEIRPAPYPADTSAKGWRFELDYERIERSGTWALAGPEARPWLLMMWMKAWGQLPCGSMPNDEEIIAALIGMPPDLWAKHRRALLRGWWLADDGRYYSRMLTDHVQEFLCNRARGYLKFRDEVIARDGSRCAYCFRTDVALSLDHVFPRSRGGLDDPSNLVPACKRCNSSKGARTPEEWRGL